MANKGAQKYPPPGAPGAPGAGGAAGAAAARARANAATEPDPRKAERGLYFEHTDLYQFLEQVKAALLKKRSLVAISSPVNVIGDLHGSYRTVFNIFELYGWPGTQTYLFLGDYVDRGNRSLEVIVLLMSCFLQYPESFILLRGNHETPRVNQRYGFRKDLMTIYGKEEGQRVWMKFNHTFSAMPIAGVVNGRILCMHGGLSPHLHSLNDILNIRRPIFVTSDKESPLAHDLMWADPSQDECEGKYEMKEGEAVMKQEQKKVHSFKESFWNVVSRWFLCTEEFNTVGRYDTNAKRSTSVIFDRDEVLRQLHHLGIDMVIRAHEVQPFGYAFFADRKLLTIFSRPNYGDSRNYGAIAKVDNEGQVTLHIMMPYAAEKDASMRPVVQQDRPPSTHFEG